MTEPGAPLHDTRATASLWTLLAGNFLIGTGVLMPMAMLEEIAGGFEVSMTMAAQLLTVGGLVIGLGAPVLAYLTNGMDRRKLLAICLAVYAAGHAASVLAPSMAALIMVRAATVTAAAVFSPQAAVAVALLMPPEKRESGIAFIFTGWALAVVAGVPVAGIAATHLGWHAVQIGMSALCCALLLVTWSVLPRPLMPPRLDLTAGKTVITHPQLLAILSVTMLSSAGQFTVFSILSPMLSAGFGATPQQVALAFVIAGIGGIAGNLLASRAIDRLGNDVLSAASIAALVVGIAVFAVAFGKLGLGLIGVFVWGLGSFAVTSLQQSRLVRAAPSLAAMTVALNTSMLYLGQAIGAITGSLAIHGAISSRVAWLALLFVCSALVLSLGISYLTRRVTVRAKRDI